MFTDKQDALRRLEEALLEDEDVQPALAPEAPEDEDLLSEDFLDALLEDERPGKAEVAYQNFSNAYGQACEDDPETLPPKKDHFAWVIVICLVLILALGALIYWMLRQGGLL